MKNLNSKYFIYFNYNYICLCNCIDKLYLLMVCVRFYFFLVDELSDRHMSNKGGKIRISK